MINLLLIEDDAGLIELITEQLEEVGCSVISTTSGASALESLKEQTPDMILLDYSLPDFNGKELIESLSRHQDPPPFIITTGQGDERIAVEMMKLGARDYLVKDTHFLAKLPDVVKRVIIEIEREGKLQQAEEKIRIAEENIINTFNLSPSIICKANLATGYFIEASQAVTKILGYSVKEFTSTPFIELVHPDDQQKSTDEKDEQIEGKEVTFFENRYLCKDGSYKWLSWYGTKADENGIVTAIGSDITERKDSEKLLAGEKERLAVTLRSIGEGVITTDIEGHVVLVNRVAEKLTGWLQKEVEGKPLTTVFHIINEQTRKSLTNPVEDVLAFGEIKDSVNNIVLIANKGTEYQIAYSGAPIKNENDEINGVVIVFRDMTDQYKMEEQLRQSQKMDAIGQLAGGVAHDFNNMLSGIMGCAQLISRKVSEDKILSRYTNLIMDASMQAAELTQRLLSFSHKAKSENETFDVHECISKIQTMLGRSIDKNIIIKSKTEAIHSNIHGDKSQIQNALLNLGINARDAMPSGGELTFTTRDFDCDRTSSNAELNLTPGKYIEIDIEDSGIGMTKEIKDHLFEPFFTTKDLGKGTGLGLSIVYNTIKGNQGHIHIYSEVDQGSVFKIFLPVMPDEVKKEAKTNEQLVTGSGMVLVVDDESSILFVVGEMLRELGYHVLIANGAEESLNIYKEQWTHIDLVILDMVMPKMNGRDVFYAIKAINPQIKVLISSGYSKDISIEKLIEDGVSGFIKKPYKHYELSKKVGEILSS